MVRGGDDGLAQSWIFRGLVGSSLGIGVGPGNAGLRKHVRNHCPQRQNPVAQVLLESGKRLVGKGSPSTRTVAARLKNGYGHTLGMWTVCVDHTYPGGRVWSDDAPGGREDVLVLTRLLWVGARPHEV